MCELMKPIANRIKGRFIFLEARKTEKAQERKGPSKKASH